MSGKIRNTKGGRAVLKAVEPIVRKAGAQCRMELAPGHGGHHRLVLLFNGQERFTPISSSPANADRAIWYKLNDVKKLLREMGADA
jgi:hypothetical protein